jgi:hypothetical protein
MRRHIRNGQAFAEAGERALEGRTYLAAEGGFQRFTQQLLEHITSPCSPLRATLPVKPSQTITSTLPA